MKRFIAPILKRIGFSPTQPKRDYWGAMQNRLTNDWVGAISTADNEIKSGLKTVRARVRELERNNDYVRRYFKLLENNVLGHCGVGLQMKIREFVKDGGKFVEQYDDRANSMIEDAWEKWGMYDKCTIGKKLCWMDLQRLALRSTARDGAVLIRKHYPKDNPFRFSLEPIEADHLDTNYEARLPNSYVRLGIEYDMQGAVVAYHIFSEHPGDTFQPSAMNGRYRERVPASQMIHLYMPDRFGQGDGMPWLVSSMVGLKHLDAYYEAEVIAARAGASKFSVYENIPGMAPVPYEGQPDSNGNIQESYTAGTIGNAPYGKTLKQIDPTHPSTAFPDFVKAMLRKYSSGLGVSYSSMANDYSDVNFSSLRGALLEEREEWKSIQGWFINWLIQPIFNEWLTTALSFGAITDNGQTLPAAKMDKFNKPEWKPRRWDWVDPLKDLQANVLAVEKGFKSRRQIISENGGDIEDTFADIEADEVLAEDHDLDFDKEATASMAANEQQQTPDAPDDPALTKPKS